MGQIVHLSAVSRVSTRKMMWVCKITGGGGSDVRSEGSHVRGGDLKLEVGS